MQVKESATDRWLARRALCGDRSAYELLFERQFGRVHAYTRRRSPSRKDAETATTRALLQVFARLDRVADGEDATWLCFVAARASLGTSDVHAPVIESPR